MMSPARNPQFHPALTRLAAALWVVVLPAAAAVAASGSSPAKPGTQPSPPMQWRIESPSSEDGGANFVFLNDGKPMKIQAWTLPRTFLGVDLLELTPELRQHYGSTAETGVLISRVAPDSPAAKAGLAVGDVLTRIDGQEIHGTFEVVQKINGHKGGEEVSLEVVRDRNTRRFRATVEEREKPQLDIGYFFRTCDDEDGDCTQPPSAISPPNLLSPPSFIQGLGPAMQSLSIDPERFAKAMEELDQRLDSPEWRAKSLALSDRIEQLEKRIQELERELGDKKP